MRADQITRLEQQRERVTRRLQELLDTPEAERPEDPQALKAFLHDIELETKLLEQLNALLTVTVSSGAARAQRLAEAQANGDDVLIATIPKGEGAEIHVAVRGWSGRKTIDLRVFDRGGGELKATRKGLQFDARRLPELLEALTQAQQHV